MILVPLYCSFSTSSLDGILNPFRCSTEGCLGPPGNICVGAAEGVGTKFGAAELLLYRLVVMVGLIVLV